VEAFLVEARNPAIWSTLLQSLTKETHLRQWAQWFEGTMHYYGCQYEEIRLLSLKALREELRGL